MQNLGKRKKTLHEMGFDCNLGNGIHKYLGTECGILYHEKNGGCNLGLFFLKKELECRNFGQDNLQDRKVTTVILLLITVVAGSNRT